jgi:ATP-dependent DNA helicase RecG
MDQAALGLLLDELITGWENEVVEFKQVDDSFSTSKIGEYFSALANEANLHNTEKGWLIFGIDNRTRTIVGSNYRKNKERLYSLKHQISQGTEPSITFRDIYELDIPDGRVLLFEIPAAPMGIPIAWNGHYYARAGESLTHLGLDKLDRIRKQVGSTDWSAQIVTEATIEHLDPDALKKAREGFAQKYKNRFDLNEVMSWSDVTFLDRAKITTGGKITRTALLLLGKSESSYFLSPHPAQMTWKLVGEERAYEHFSLPFLLTTGFLYNKIRNVQLKILPANELVAVELAKYDQQIVLEALHNCIAHQDYLRGGRILVTEFIDRLTLENEGSFFDGQPDDYISGHKTPRKYRNPFLTQAMAELGMIDTMGCGIHEMYTGQARRYFPLPDYDLNEPQAVKMTIYGRIVDLAYSRMLIQKTNLTLEEIVALDRVQKHLPLQNDIIKHLREEKLIEGRKPNFHVSAFVAGATATKADYIHTRAQDNAYYQKLIVDYLKKFQSATRKEIDTLLWSKLSDALSNTQKQRKINNLLTHMHNNGKLKNSKIN